MIICIFFCPFLCFTADANSVYSIFIELRSLMLHYACHTPNFLYIRVYMGVRIYTCAAMFQTFASVPARGDICDAAVGFLLFVDRCIFPLHVGVTRSDTISIIILGTRKKKEGEREKKSIFIVDNTAPISMNHFYTRTLFLLFFAHKKNLHSYLSSRA